MIGAHISFSKPMSDIIVNAQSLGLETFQIFTRNARNMRQRDIYSQELAEFNRDVLISGLSSYVIHAPYSMNPASPESYKRSSAIQMIKQDMLLLDSMAGKKYYVLHPGSHMGVGEDTGVDYLIDTLNAVGYTNTTICVELMAGAGTELMSTINSVNRFLNNCKGLNIKLTFDTCHVFGAGLPIVNLYKYLKDSVGVVHVNDSQYASGTFKDRHANLECGHILIGAIKELCRLIPEDTPIILETPAAGILRDIALLKLFVS